MSVAPFITETFAPLWRRTTYAAALYLLLALPIGIVAFVLLVVGTALGVGLTVVWIGVPILLGTLAASRAFAAFDRGLVNRLLGIAVPAPAAQRSGGGSLFKQVGTLVRAGSTWRSILWLALRFPLGLIAFCLPLVVLTAGAALVVAPFSSSFAHAHDVAGSSAATTALCVAGGLALIVLTTHLIDGLAWVHGALARGLLGPSGREELERLAARTAQATARADLARELHDSVGHSVTAAVLQASAARRVLHTDLAFVDGALAAIEDQGRVALDELDRVLAVLRDEERSEPRPAPTLADLDALIERTRAAGVELAVTRNGDFGRVPAAVGREAFRVLQEALTNVMRHASGAAAAVTLTVGERTLELSVENGPGTSIQPGRTSGGNGLRGVSERVRALDGLLTTSVLPGGGYLLRAELPLAARA